GTFANSDGIRGSRPQRPASKEVAWYFLGYPVCLRIDLVNYRATVIRYPNGSFSQSQTRIAEWTNGSEDGNFRNRIIAWMNANEFIRREIHHPDKTKTDAHDLPSPRNRRLDVRVRN